jgi:hypothetical protein
LKGFFNPLIFKGFLRLSGQRHSSSRPSRKGVRVEASSYTFDISDGRVEQGENTEHQQLHEELVLSESTLDAAIGTAADSNNVI